MALVSACGGPTRPSKPTETSPPPSSSPGTPTPPPAADPPATPAPPAATVKLTGAITEGGTPLAVARIAVEDGPDIGRTAVSDAAGRYAFEGLQPGSITLKAEKEGYDNSYVKVTLTGSAMEQNVTMSKAAPPPSPRPSGGVISFVSSDPAPGGETVLTDYGTLVRLAALKMQFTVNFGTALPDAKLQVDLLNDSGQLCAFTFVDQAIAANANVTVTVANGMNWEGQTCGAYPAAIARVRATLLTLRGPEVNGRLQRTDYATETFPIRYTVRRYPLPPSNPPAAAPSISDLTWRVMLPVGGDPPIAGDPVGITCVARESDGAPLTVTLTITWDGLAPARYTQGFPAGASSSPSGAWHGIYVTAPSNAPAPHARVDCVATNDRGQTAQKSVEIGKAR